ncbi:MAG: hypothetical protein GY940_47695 [bacterium]|nr:hypothetical protein [bacterium]
MKGANYIPQDSFVNRVTEGDYKAVIDNAVKANMNMLRVWGGGIYEKDIFYDLCDEAGILVWQDFMFACAMYPGDNDFIENVRQEAMDNVKRLRNHPCIALWCGNNEVDEGWHNWGWGSSFKGEQRERIWEDYERVFHGILPRVVSQYDPGRFYWASSPRFGRGNRRSLYEGDSHYWGVWHDAEPFGIFKERVGRFMSEQGFQSFPPMETIKGFTLPGDRALDSEVMKGHQKHPRGNKLIKTYMKRDYPKARDFEQFVYLSQVVQAEGLKVGMEAHRRAMPYCMGTLYWQLNDCWPVVSWSGLDYYGNWKALHYFVKKAYAPILVSPVEEEGKLRVYLVSDRLEPEVGTLRVKLTDLRGKELWRRDMRVRAEANASRVVFETGTEPLPEGRRKGELMLVTDFMKDERIEASNVYYFAPPKDLELSRAAIKIKFSRVRGEAAGIELWSDKLVKNIYLKAEGMRGYFTDNFFDLPPDRWVKVFFAGEGLNEAEILRGIKEKLEIMTMSGETEIVKVD